MDLQYSNKCFACGKDNPIGLKLDIKLDEDAAITHFELNENYVGWDNIVHGGIIATILDEVMAWISIYKDYWVVTKELKVQYKLPVKINTKYKAVGRIKKVEGRYVYCEAFIIDEKGKIYSKGEGIYAVLKKRRRG